MNKIILATAGLALLAAPAAFAADGTVTINGSVAAACVIAPSATITLGEMADSNGLYNSVANGKTATLAGWCNGAASTMSVVANPIVLQGVHTTPTGFTDTVNYTATAAVTPAGAGSPVSTSDSTTAAAAAAATVGLFNGNITVTLSASATPAGQLIAGSYSGTTVVTLTPST